MIGIATNGVERVEFGTSEVVFNDGGANYDFRIEGDTNASLFFVDASAEAVGIGTASMPRDAFWLVRLLTTAHLILDYKLQAPDQDLPFFFQDTKIQVMGLSYFLQNPAVVLLGQILSCKVATLLAYLSSEELTVLTT
jgi:hypothetical protein